jgi:NAD(P)-dependent dehydrogenase (short-subunit alcohol dehydrogenase family)
VVRTTLPAMLNTGVIITGGASGIGFATAEALLASGRPVTIWDLGDERVETARARLAIHGIAVGACALDVTDYGRLGGAVEAARDVMGTIGGLVHAAGTIIAEPIDEVEWDNWNSQIEVHLNAFARVTQAVLPDLRANDGSAIVGISSINGLIGNEANPAYCAAKAGIMGLVRSLTARLGTFGIRVNAICPGYIETPMTARSLSMPERRARFVATSSLGRLGQPAEIGNVARFLLSDEASFVTGQSIAVDGGVTTTV